MTAEDMSVLMDGLVNEARSSRDSTFNALDAAERECRRNTQRLAAQVDRYVAVHETSMAEILRLEVPRLLAERDGAQPAGDQESDQESDPDKHVPPAERDSRFDPEDEWDGGWDVAAASSTPSVSADNRVRHDDTDDDGYPDTWLR